MKRLISFSLYGERPKDVVNAVINCLLAPHVYPGWTCRFYVDDTVPAAAQSLLRSFPNVEIAEMPRHRDGGAMLWRFLPASEPDLDAMISRDADSWLSSREAACVNEWLESGRPFHIIRDHCYHSQKVMGGMWGVRGGVLPHMREWVEHFLRDGSYDQEFLAERVYPLMVDDAVIHRGEQRNDRGEVTDYFSDGARPIPAYVEVDEHVRGISFVEAHRLNAFACCHCGEAHRTYIGPIFERIPYRALRVVRTLAEQHGIPPKTIPGLVQPHPLVVRVKKAVHPSRLRNAAWQVKVVLWRLRSRIRRARMRKQ